LCSADIGARSVKTFIAAETTINNVVVQSRPPTRLLNFIDRMFHSVLPAGVLYPAEQFNKATTTTVFVRYDRHRTNFEPG